MCEASRWRKYKRKKMKKKVQIEKVISSQTCFLQFCKLDYWNTKLTGECMSTTTDLEGGVIVLKIALKIIESCWTTITRTRRWTFVAGIISVENSIRKTKWQPIKKEQKTKNNNRMYPYRSEADCTTTESHILKSLTIPSNFWNNYTCFSGLMQHEMSINMNLNNTKKTRLVLRRSWWSWVFKFVDMQIKQWNLQSIITWNTGHDEV